MKNFIKLLLCLSYIQLYANSIDPTTLFLGSIKFPETVDNDDICLYYKGKKLTPDWDKNNLSVQFSFLESKTAQSIYLLICNDITYQTQPQSNTVLHFQATNKNYICYELRAKRIYDDLGSLTDYSWDYHEYKLENNIIPDNTVMFLFDPKLIENIQIHTWNKNQAIRLVPTIKIVHSATHPELLRTMTIARLTALDIDTLHIKDSSNNNLITPKVKTL